MNQTVCNIVTRVDRNGITTLTLNRPDHFNALSESLLNRLERSLAEISEDDSVRVVIIKANGRAYCVGHDLKEMRENTDKAYLKSQFSKAGEVMLRIKSLPQPVIAESDQFPSIICREPPAEYGAHIEE